MIHAVSVLLGVLLLLPSHLIAQARKPATISEISTYMGADREQLLYAAAKSEGVVNWYTSLAGDSYKALSRVFEAKYPGVRVEAFRAGGSDLVTRMSEETKAHVRLAKNCPESQAGVGLFFRHTWVSGEHW